ncbi:MAG: DUF1294 domain-containing protein [Cellulosilyticaceae bacterium]
MKYILLYLGILNLMGFLSMYSDKKRAKLKQYRIPEATLFMLAILGGSIGSIAGMETFRHKTKHWYFKWGLPAILIAQILVVGFIIMEYLMV